MGLRGELMRLVTVCKALVPLEFWKKFSSQPFFLHQKLKKLFFPPFVPEHSLQFLDAELKKIIVFYIDITVKTLFTAILA